MHKHTETKLKLTSPRLFDIIKKNLQVLKTLAVNPMSIIKCLHFINHAVAPMHTSVFWIFKQI